MILIVSHRDDLTADLLALKLSEAGCAFVRLNSERFLDARVTWRPEGTFLLTAEGQKFDVRDIHSVFYRFLPSPIAPPEIPDSVKDFAVREASYILRCIEGLVPPAGWINHPSSIRAADNKLLQLQLASKFGLRTPTTVLSNDPEQLYTFYREVGSVVCKTLAGGDVVLEGVRSAVFTWRLPVGLTHSDFETARRLPVLLQEWIPKSADLRAVVIDETVFVIRIQSQADEQTRTDWRRPNLRDLPHEIVQVDPPLAYSLQRFIRTLNLRFAAVDLVEPVEGSPVFLEINPNGQWAWLQEVTGAQIAEAFIAALT